MKLSRAISGEQDRDYAEGLDACKSLTSLRAHVDEFRELAVDAKAVVDAMTEDDWPVFLKGLKSERRGKFMSEEWAQRYGPVLIPLPMMSISRIAQDFGCPFGVAWYRCKELRPDILHVPVAKQRERVRTTFSGGSRRNSDD